MSYQRIKEDWKRKLMSLNVRGFFANWAPQRVRSLFNLRPTVEYVPEHAQQRMRDNVSEILD